MMLIKNDNPAQVQKEQPEAIPAATHEALNLLLKSNHEKFLDLKQPPLITKYLEKKLIMF